MGRVLPHAGESQHRSRGQHVRQHDVTRVGVDGLCGSDHSPSDKRARKCIVEAPGGDLVRDSGVPLPLPQLGLGRVGPCLRARHRQASGSPAAGWHHHDGMREVTLGAVSGMTADGRSRGGICLGTEETAGSRRSSFQEQGGSSCLLARISV